MCEELYMRMASQYFYQTWTKNVLKKRIPLIIFSTGPHPIYNNSPNFNLTWYYRYQEFSIKLCLRKGPDSISIHGKGRPQFHLSINPYMSRIRWVQSKLVKSYLLIYTHSVLTMRKNPIVKTEQVGLIKFDLNSDHNLWYEKFWWRPSGIVK